MSSSTTGAFQDKVVIVTGGNSGIGAATVEAFLKGGAKVASLDIRPPLTTVSDPNRFDVTCDVGEETSAEGAVAQAIRHFGTLDVLCNVAGVMDAMGRVSESETSVWERCFKVNVTGPFFLIRSATRYFLTKPWPPITTASTAGTSTTPTTRQSKPASRGTIINICSTASKSGAHAGAAYTSSKHAMLGLSRSTAWMYAKEGIRCNAVLPGGVKTNILSNSGFVPEDIGRADGFRAVLGVQQAMPDYVEASDVASAILFLVANQSVNGAEVEVDAGWTVI